MSMICQESHEKINVHFFDLCCAALITRLCRQATKTPSVNFFTSQTQMRLTDPENESEDEKTNTRKCQTCAESCWPSWLWVTCEFCFPKRKKINDRKRNYSGALIINLLTSLHVVFWHSAHRCRYLWWSQDLNWETEISFVTTHCDKVILLLVTVRKRSVTQVGPS